MAVRRADLEAARIRLVDPSGAGASGRAVEVRTPAAGRVLRVLQESESVVGQGAPLLEIGGPGDIEVVAELLSSDAARVQAGVETIIDAWGGPPLRGQVRLVEPYGFLKISALGVEEQRVNVVVDPVDPPTAWRAVGHGYRVETAIVVSRAASAVRVPVGSLFRNEGNWAVFRIERGRAHLAPVTVGRNDGQLAEVLSGLRAGDRVVVHPGQAVSDGARVRARAS